MCALYKIQEYLILDSKGKVVTFLHKDDVGNDYELSDLTPSFLDPYNRRYLFKDDEGIYYTIVEEELTPIEETELTAEVFETYGIPDLPDGNMLIGLKILRFFIGMIQ